MDPDDIPLTLLRPAMSFQPGRFSGLCVFLAVSLFLAGVSSGADWIADGQIEVVFEDNLSRARKEPDQKSDVAIAPSIAAGQFRQIADYTSLTVTANFEGALFRRLERLSQYSAGLEIGVRHKMGLGLLAPWWRVSAAGAFVDVRDSVRDAALFSPTLEVGKRLHNRLNLSSGYSYEILEAVHNALYDQGGHNGFLNVEWALTPTLTFSARYQVREGDFIAHTSQGLQRFNPNALPVVRTFDTLMRANRLNGWTHMASFGLSYSLSERSSLQFEYQRQETLTSTFDYSNNIYQIGLSYSF